MLYRATVAAYCHNIMKHVNTRTMYEQNHLLSQQAVRKVTSVL
jgi:hypothetical protein